MAKLSDRMNRAETFTDARLLRVTRDARLFANTLDSLAEPTGIVRRDPDELRSAVGFYLADDNGDPPSRDDFERWCAELVREKWALDFTSQGLKLLYLQGFGKRQKGANVCVGVEKANGAISPHLPMPACVRLEPHEQTDKDTHELYVRKYLPRHCESDYTCCPCEWYPHGTPIEHAPYPKGEESQSDVSRVDLEPSSCEKSESKGMPGEQGDGQRRKEEEPGVGALSQAVNDLCDAYPKLSREGQNGAGNKLFALSVQYGDAKVIDAIYSAIEHEARSPLPYVSKCLEESRVLPDD